MLSLNQDIQVVGEASDGREAIDRARSCAPNVVVMDMAMPGMDGLQATKRLARDFAGVRVLVLSQHDNERYILPVLQAGASGFISKVAASSDLTSGIRSVHHGDSYLSPSVAKLLVEDLQHGVGGRVSHDPYELLTDRERDVLKLVAEGYSTQEIADILVVSPKTVEGHKTRLMAKLDIHNRIDLVKYALRKGIINI